ncbi:MAG: hypothetical protein PF489_11775 [Salinivirgaceae bacterium]|jgi:uncharacterized membrane protein|nr:hypothetical protein [Salinivirgaceae bacterium]
MELVELIGYLASVLIMVSMMTISIMKGRVITILGGLLFIAYGLYIESQPVAVLNAFIVLFNLYYMYRYVFHYDDFKLLEITAKGNYSDEFFQFFEHDIKRFFPTFKFEVDYERKVFLILKNMIVSGMLVGYEREGSFIIEMDYAIPKYRDFKLGRYLYQQTPEVFTTSYTQFVAETENAAHKKYLLKMGFHPVEEMGSTYYVKLL